MAGAGAWQGHGMARLGHTMTVAWQGQDKAVVVWCGMGHGWGWGMVGRISWLGHGMVGAWHVRGHGCGMSVVVWRDMGEVGMDMWVRHDEHCISLTCCVNVRCRVCY